MLLVTGGGGAGAGRGAGRAGGGGGGGATVGAGFGCEAHAANPANIAAAALIRTERMKIEPFSVIKVPDSQV